MDITSLDNELNMGDRRLDGIRLIKDGNFFKCKLGRTFRKS